MTPILYLELLQNWLTVSYILLTADMKMTSSSVSITCACRSQSRVVLARCDGKQSEWFIKNVHTAPTFL